MKSIKEKEILVNFAKSLGQEVDPALIEEVERYKTIKAQVAESVKRNVFSDLTNAIKEEKEETATVIEPIQYPLPPSLDELTFILNETIEETKNELVQAQAIEDSPITEETVPDTTRPSLAEQAAKLISEAPKNSFQQPDPIVVPENLDAIRGKLKFLEQWVSKISSAGPGSGETKLRFLDDVDRPSIADNLYLKYDANKGKFTFDVGHINSFSCSIQSNTNQRVYANTETLIHYNTVDWADGFRLESNTRIVTEHPGKYNLQYSIQLENSGAQISDVSIWLKQNGQQVKNTNSRYDVVAKHAGANGAIIAAINYFYKTTVANEYVELAWWTPHWDDTFISTIPEMLAIPEIQPNIPETPAVILTVSPVKVDSN